MDKQLEKTKGKNGGGSDTTVTDDDDEEEEEEEEVNGIESKSEGKSTATGSRDDSKSIEQEAAAQSSQKMKDFGPGGLSNVEVQARFAEVLAAASLDKNVSERPKYNTIKNPNQHGHAGWTTNASALDLPEGAGGP